MIEQQIHDIEGVLEVGKVYRADFPVEKNMAPILPAHHAIHIEWANPEKMTKSEDVKKIVFKVLKTSTTKVSDQLRWNDEYVCEILS